MDRAAAARQWACQQQLVRFFHFLDAKRYAEAAALFDADAVWRRPASAIEGRGAILTALLERPPQRLTRHVVSNFLVGADSGDRVEAACMLTTYAVEHATPGVAPALVDTLAGLFTAKASFACGEGTPLIAQLELAPDLAFAR